ncbi:hypothetical protein HBB16_12200 [Pseudonocardia sp. MCCB 268]|nr:hypothetical protein [Pseudonocardia cytotoxica]
MNGVLGPAHPAPPHAGPRGEPEYLERPAHASTVDGSWPGNVPAGDVSVGPSAVPAADEDAWLQDWASGHVGWDVASPAATGRVLRPSPGRTHHRRPAEHTHRPGEHTDPGPGRRRAPDRPTSVPAGRGEHGRGPDRRTTDRPRGTPPLTRRARRRPTDTRCRTDRASQVDADCRRRGALTRPRRRPDGRVLISTPRGSQTLHLGPSCAVPGTPLPTEDRRRRRRRRTWLPRRH